MNIRRTWPIIAAAVLSSMMVGEARAQAPTPTSSSGQAVDGERTPISLVGCIQREADYRRTQRSGRGGVAGSGAGRGNEYVLINASPAASNAAASPTMDCSFESTGEAYELTGEGERELGKYVNRVVQVSGMLKAAETEPVGTSGATQPTGGFDPLGQDLKLREINVTSFQEVTAPARSAGAVSPDTTTPARTVEPRRAAEPQPTGTTGAEQQRDELPRTASPLPIAGLLGLLSLGGAVALRMTRR
jgi:hypothetical protein